MLANVALDDPMQFANQTLYYSEHALVFNRRGERYIDETLGDHLTAMATVQQPDARCLVVADQRVRDDWMLGAYVEGIAPVDRFELCRRRGGRFALADSLEDFDYLPDDWGYPGGVIRQAIERFNEGARGGKPDALGRRFDPLPFDHPPYYVIEGQAAITFTFGGILVDEQARRSTTTAVRSPVCWPPAPTPVDCSCRRTGRSGGRCGVRPAGGRDGPGSAPVSGDALPLLGQWAVVTGGSMGIGKAIVERFVQGGANVVAVARGRAALDEAVASARCSPTTGRRSSPSPPTSPRVPAWTPCSPSSPTGCRH